MTNLPLLSDDENGLPQNPEIIPDHIDAVVGSKDRLLDFIDNWCGLDASAEETAEMLHSDGGKYYSEWLPKELGDALLSERINPELMAKRENIHFDDQDQLNQYFGRCWSLWFPELPYPLDTQHK